METNDKDNQTMTTKKTLNLWAIYGICLLISTVFFFLFGFNSPIYTFNSDNDYNWFMTVGHGLVADKLPYRDLFEHKGPIVYLVTGFCCLFPNPNVTMLFLEIIPMSLFFFFTYRIAIKHLNTFYSLLAVSIMAVTIFTSWCRTHSAATVEEFTLPIYAYFLLCWLEFFLEKREWNWVRALCLGLCFGVMIWVKYTLIYFIIVPIIIWLIQSLRARQYRTLIINILLIIAGIIIITLPNLIFFAANHALNDLIYVYFIINLTAYGTTNLFMVLTSFGIFFLIGPILLFFILWGVARFTIKYWREHTGYLLLISFLITLGLLTWSAKTITYYFSELIPYAILGIVDVLTWVSAKLTLPHWRKRLYIAITGLCVLVTIPLSIYTYEIGRGRNAYTPLVIADEIHAYETTNNTTATLYCYKIGDFGFYNAAGIVPNNYFFGNNVFDEDRFPSMYQAFNYYITNQTSDFVVTERSTWETEQNFLSQYYQPYINNDLDASTYHYHKMHYFYYRNYDFVLLIKKS